MGPTLLIGMDGATFTVLDPYIEAIYDPYSKQYAGRLGIEVRTIKSVSLIAATEIRQDGPGFAVGLRYRF